MGRLENIIERNRNPKRGERMTVGIGFGVFILIIIALMVFTDLGARPDATQPAPTSEKRVRDVKLGAPTAPGSAARSP